MKIKHFLGKQSVLLSYSVEHLSCTFNFLNKLCLIALRKWAGIGSAGFCGELQACLQEWDIIAVNKGLSLAHDWIWKIHSLLPCSLIPQPLPSPHPPFWYDVICISPWSTRVWRLWGQRKEVAKGSWLLPVRMVVEQTVWMPMCQLVVLRSIR